ncbi:MAG: hypothetical protein CR971_00250 [candidate division SR1 bacterium]|nr:MAG: hypothetical protein CR971_00250 [candidate division SR1 bacterium]
MTEKKKTVRQQNKTSSTKKEGKQVDITVEAKEKFDEISTEAKEKFDEASVVLKKEAKVVEKKGRKLLGSMSTWWNHASTAEKISMIFGIIFLLVALRRLRQIIVGVVFLILGVLGITGFFVKKDE